LSQDKNCLKYTVHVAEIRP